MFSVTVPNEAILAAVDSTKLWSAFGVAIGVFLLLLLLGHFIAAKLLVPSPSIGRVLGAWFMNIAFCGLMIPVSIFFSLAGVRDFGLASLVISLVMILVGGAITAGIYKIGVGRGIVYNLAVGLAMWGVAWSASKVLESEYNPLVYFYGKKPVASTQEPASGQSAQVKDYAGQSASNGVPNPAPLYPTSQEAQAAAMKQYPELAQAGSAFNKRFLEKHRAYKEQNSSILNSPDWPITVAREVAAELKTP